MNNSTKKPEMAGYYYDWIEVCDYINDKYSFDLDEFQHFWFKIEDSTRLNIEHRESWENENYPLIKKFRENPLPNKLFNQEGFDYLSTKEGSRWRQEIREAYCNAPDGECKEYPFYSLWHWLLEIREIHNGSLITINWKELGEEAEEDWQKYICNIFVDEFGDKDIHYHVWW